MDGWPLSHYQAPRVATSALSVSPPAHYLPCHPILCRMTLDHPFDHPDDPTRPFSIRLDRRRLQREQPRSVWSRPVRRGAPGYGSGGWGVRIPRGAPIGIVFEPANLLSPERVPASPRSQLRPSTSMEYPACFSSSLASPQSGDRGPGRRLRRPRGAPRICQPATKGQFAVTSACQV
jgi:hypothetical protein